MPSKAKFKIAGMTFQFSSSYPKPIVWLRQNFDIYLSEDAPDLDISLEFKKSYRTNIALGNSELISENGAFYLKTAFFDVKGNYANGKIDVVSNYNMGVADLTRALFSVMAVKRGGILLHASAIADNDYSYVFCGPSESGKTTIARLSGERDVLTDESTAIISKDNRYYAYSTPFFGEFGRVSKNMGAPIKAVFFIRKGNGFSHKRISKVEAMSDFLNNIILRGRDLALTEKVLDNVYKLANSVPCYELFFKPDAGLWRYINDNV